LKSQKVSTIASPENEDKALSVAVAVAVAVEPVASHLSVSSRNDGNSSANYYNSHEDKVCPSCRVESIITNWCEGDQVCTNCGVVVADRIFDTRFKIINYKTKYT
jgi:hypothetical protein